MEFKKVLDMDFWEEVYELDGTGGFCEFLEGILNFLIFFCWNLLELC